MLVFTSAVPDAVKEFEPLQLSDCGVGVGYRSQIARPHHITILYVMLLLSDKLWNWTEWKVAPKSWLVSA